MRAKGSKNSFKCERAKRAHYLGKYDIAIYDMDDEFEDIVANGHELAKWLGYEDTARWMRCGMLSNYYNHHNERPMKIKDTNGTFHTLAFIKTEEKENG